MAAAFQTSAYHHPVIGWMADIQEYQLSDLKSWYHHWYNPANATLVVVGDVQPERVKLLADKYFGPLKPVTVAGPKPRPEVAQEGLRRIVVKVPAKLPYVVLGYKVPTVKTARTEWEPYALAVLAAALDGDDSARLSRYLVRGDEVAAQAGADYGPYDRLTSLFTLDGTPAKGRTLDAVEAALRAQVRRLREEPLSAEELNKIKTQVVASDVYQRDSVFYQAMRIGVLETVGVGWRAGEEYVSRIRAVSPAQVQAVARKYLVDDGLTVAVLDPQPLGNRTPQPSAGVPHDIR